MRGELNKKQVLTQPSQSNWQVEGGPRTNTIRSKAAAYAGTIMRGS